jgi:hypothetical protein
LFLHKYAEWGTFKKVEKKTEKTGKNTTNGL